MVPDDSFPPDPWMQRHGSALALAILAAIVAGGLLLACSLTGCRAEVRVETRPVAAPAPADEHDDPCANGACDVPPRPPAAPKR